MGTSGITWIPPEQSVLIALVKKHRGRISRIADELDISIDTLHKYVDSNVEFNEALNAARQKYIHDVCQKSEETLNVAQDRRDIDMNCALKSAFFCLNNLGARYGYSKDNFTGDKEVKVLVTHYDQQEKKD